MDVSVELSTREVASLALKIELWTVLMYKEMTHHNIKGSSPQGIIRMTVRAMNI